MCGAASSSSRTKNDKDNNVFETVRSIFSTKARDFITAVDEKNIILVKEVKAGEGYNELHKTAEVIVDMLNTEAHDESACGIRHHRERD